jgi:hypothetical protein
MALIQHALENVNPDKNQGEASTSPEMPQMPGKPPEPGERTRKSQLCPHVGLRFLASDLWENKFL